MICRTDPPPRHKIAQKESTMKVKEFTLCEDGMQDKAMAEQFSHHGGCSSDLSQEASTIHGQHRWLCWKYIIILRARLLNSTNLN